MLDIVNVYQNYTWKDGDYNPLIESIGVKILIDESGYGHSGGDSLLLLQRYSDNKYGYLCFGFGSCSNCDALKGCDTFKELEELRDQLNDSIKWFDTKEEVLKYLDIKDWEGTHLSDDFYLSFNNKVRLFFKEQPQYRDVRVELINKEILDAIYACIKIKGFNRLLIDLNEYISLQVESARIRMLISNTYLGISYDSKFCEIRDYEVLKNELIKFYEKAHTVFNRELREKIKAEDNNDITLLINLEEDDK